MTMKTVRLKKLKKSHQLMTQKLLRHHRSRVDAAINNCWSLKDIPEHIRDLECEQACLRAQLSVIRIFEKGSHKIIFYHRKTNVSIKSIRLAKNYPAEKCFPEKIR